MDLQRELIESQKQKGTSRTRNASAASLAAHGVLIAAIVFAGSQTSHKVDAEESKIPTFISQGAAPPPPPPPPPPKASASTPQQQPRVVPKVQQPQPTFTQPTEIPKDVPKVDPIPTEGLDTLDTTPTEAVPSTGADISGVAGGVPGGVVGGEVGGVVGGEVGGVVGGVVGGQLGGTGTGTEGTGTGGPEAPVVAAPPLPPPAPEEPPSGPLRVGGDVKAPVIAHREDPEYTEIARQGRVSGVVVVEAIIDKRGNVDSVKVVKGLPMGLSEAAVRAVRQWKFKPGTLNGEAVDTIFNLTVNFKLN